MFDKRPVDVSVATAHCLSCGEVPAIFHPRFPWRCPLCGRAVDPATYKVVKLSGSAKGTSPVHRLANSVVDVCNEQLYIDQERDDDFAKWRADREYELRAGHEEVRRTTLELHGDVVPESDGDDDDRGEQLLAEEEDEDRIEQLLALEEDEYWQHEEYLEPFGDVPQFIAYLAELTLKELNSVRGADGERGEPQDVREAAFGILEEHSLRAVVAVPQPPPWEAWDAEGIPALHAAAEVISAECADLLNDRMLVVGLPSELEVGWTDSTATDNEPRFRRSMKLPLWPGDPTVPSEIRVYLDENFSGEQWTIGFRVELCDEKESAWYEEENGGSPSQIVDAFRKCGASLRNLMTPGVEDFTASPADSSIIDDDIPF